MTRITTEPRGTERSVPRYRGRHRAPWISTVGPWVRRNPLVSVMALVVALWLPYGALDATGALWSLAPLEGVSVAVVPPACPGEQGGEILPCSWRCDRMGNGQCGPASPRLVIYRRGEADSVLACAPLGTGEVCADVESDAPIEYVGSDGSLYRLAGGDS